MNEVSSYSVLMSVYKNDNAMFFKEAINSILNQTVKSDDIVLVVDGPIEGTLLQNVKSIDKEKKEVKIVWLPENIGLGNALAEGMKHVKHDLVARMDSDDISVPSRMETQLNMFETNPKLDIASSQIAEFENDINKVLTYRKLPTEHFEIIKFAHRYSPFNHPAVMMKKSIYNKAGGYQDWPRNEDYYLWARMINSGAITANSSENLLFYRIDTGNLKRKTNWIQAKYSIKLHWFFWKKMNFGTFLDAVLLAIIHLMVFLMPRVVFKWMYLNLR